MTYLEVARQLDQQHRPVEAAWAYEIAQARSEVGRDAVLDLAAIYFLCQDPGFAAAHDIPQAFAEAASTRLFDLLQQARDTFENDADIEAWQLYARERISFEDVDDSLYERLALAGESELALVRLYISSGGQRFSRETRIIEAELLRTHTERARYLASLIGSAVLPQ